MLVSLVQQFVTLNYMTYLINYFYIKILENSYLLRFSSNFHDLYVCVIVAIAESFYKFFLLFYYCWCIFLIISLFVLCMLGFGLLVC